MTSLNRCAGLIIGLLLLATDPLHAQKAERPGIDTEPVLRIEAGGPTAFVTSLAFSADEQTLYAAGYDKVVHAWTLSGGKFVASKDAYRVPIGPGVTGSINSVALSSDGAWLAVASRGVMRSGATFRESGIWVPSVGVVSDDMWEDQGTILVYNTRTGDARPLRGHRGRVVSLAFAPGKTGAPLLSSVAREVQGKDFTGAVRLWDVAQAKEIAHLTKLPDLALGNRALWPHLAVWRSGAKGDSIRVASAWEDGQLRLWDGQSRVSATPDGDFNNSIAQLPGKEQVLTGSVRDGKGVLTLWDLGGVKPTVLRQVELAKGHKPRVLVLLPGDAGAIVSRAAVIIETATDKEHEYLLSVVDLADLKPVRSALRLWTSSSATSPTLAVSPNGRFLAAAGNKEHDIHLLTVADLLAKRDDRQRLRGGGELFRSAAFVKNGTALGVVLGESAAAGLGKPPRRPRAGDLVFDFTGRRLLDDVAGWELIAPPLDGWETRARTVRDDQGRIKEHQIQVWDKDTELAGVRLQASEFITDYALLPSRGKRPPLLAVALLDLGQPILRLYDARTGEHLTQLTGHVNRIHALAFSGDGRLLVSAAEDQTVCVWKLTYLDRVLGKQGMIHGLIPGEREPGGLSVAQLDNAALSRENRRKLDDAGVQEGDTIDGLVTKNKLQPLASLRDFYDRIVLVAPGQNVTLRFRKRGDVALRVGQVTNEMKPLLTLFVTQPSRGNVRHWIGWSPVGPYDFSDRDAERLLGWQQNTNDPKRPTLFAEAAQHRAIYYKPDILRYLVAAADTAPAIEKWQRDHPEKPREPKMTLWIKELGLEPPMDAAGRVLLGQPQVTLQLALNELPAEQIRSIVWQRDDKERGAFEKNDDGDWSADLSKLAWKRGNYKLRAILRTTAEGQEFPRELTVRYQPTRPTIKAVGTLPRVVDKAEYRVRAEVTPGTGQGVNVSYQHSLDDKDLPVDPPQTLRKATTLDKTFMLQPGRNRISIQVRSEDGGADEADWLSLEVLYKTARPQISVTSVTTLPDGAPLRLDPARLDKPIIVDSPRVRVEGSIEALAPLSDVAWTTDAKDAKRQALEVEKQTKRLPLAQEVTLTEPGQLRKVRFFARTAGSEEAERSIVLKFEPRLPELRLTSPVEGQPLFAGKDAPSVRVEGRLLWPEGAHACTAQLIVNGKELEVPKALVVNAVGFSGTASLQPGENGVQVRLKNEWHETTTPKLLVSYRRPPRIVDLKAPAKAARTSVDVVAWVETAMDLPLTALRVQGHELAAAALQPAVDKQNGDKTVYRVVLKELALQKGKNVVTFQAANRDGWALQPAETSVLCEDATAPKGEVILLSPQKEAVVDRAEFPVEFLVRSPSPLKKVELLRDGKAVYRHADPGEATKTADGQFALRVKQPVPLLPGPNLLKVVVRNEDGELESPAAVLTYHTGPASIRINQIEVAGTKLEQISYTNGKLLFPAAGQAKITLRGLVQWEPASDPLLAKVAHVRVCVNGCQQPPVMLEPATPGRRERAFKAEVRLTQPSGNHIVVKLPDLAEAADSRNQCLIDCKQPEAAAEVRRQAHLLIVDTGKEVGPAVVERVLKSLAATPAGENRFSKAGFADGGRIYGPLVGADVAPERIYVQLLSIKRNLKLRAAAGAANDIVFLYFRGGELLDGQDHFLRTSDSERDPELRWSGLPCEYLTRYCADNLGAQVLLLDVTREVKDGDGCLCDKVLQWPDDPNVAVVRYAWTGQPQSQTPDARLLTDWAAALPQAHKLGEVVKVLGEKFERQARAPWPSKSFKNQLTFSEQMSSSVADLLLGRGDTP
jgi:WD40 repeat protein